MQVDSGTPSIGYLTIREQHDSYIGGLLLINVQARPIEFHCTAPVATSRAQQVLYGSALDSYVREEIGKTLLGKAKTQASFYVTDCVKWWTVSQEEDRTVLWVETNPTDPWPGASGLLRRQHEMRRAMKFELDGVTAILPASRYEEKSRLIEFWSEFGHGLDLFEPFCRITEAISEAMGDAKPAKRVA